MRTSRRLSGILSALALVALATAAYAVVFGAGFVSDDHAVLDPSGFVSRPLADVWRGKGVFDYYPVTWTVMWLEARLFGEQPLGYHVVAVALHGLAAVALWRALGSLEVPGAWIGAALFAVHPAAVESVAWVAETKNPLSSALAFAAVALWPTPGGAPRRSRQLGSLALFVLALLSKAAVVAVPVVLAGAIWVRSGRIGRGDFRRLAPFFLASLAEGVVTLGYQAGPAMAGVLLRSRGVAERIGGAGWALVEYARAAFAPVGLVLCHAEWPVSPTSPWFYAPALAAVLAYAAALLWLRRTGSWLGRALWAHAILVALVLGLLDAPYQGMAPVSNHLQYLALAAPAALGGAALHRLALRWNRGAWAVAAALIAVLAFGTRARAAAFQDSTTYWRTAVADSPESIFAVATYALVLEERGDPEGARELLRRTADSARDVAVRHRAASLLAVREGRYEDAVAEARASERLRRDPNQQVDLGWALLRAGRAAAAADVFGAIDGTAASNAGVAFGRATALAGIGRIREAAVLLRRAREKDPGNAAIEGAWRILEARMAREGMTP
ncbi:MAG TPA: hypothetical protein VF841_15915 [Anaeromyxobacter sp.]